MSRNEKTEIRNGAVLKLFFPLLFVLLVFMAWNPAQVFAADPITLTFRDSQGNSISTIPDMPLNQGGTVTLPAVPVTQEGLGNPAWKPALLYSDGMELLGSAGTLSYDDAAKLYARYGEGNKLTLYGTKLCRIRYLDNTGNKVMSTEDAFEGSTIVLRKSPNAANKRGYRGWSDKPDGGTAYAFEARFKVTQDKDFYLIWYVYVAFRNSNGSNGSAYNVLTKYVKRGHTVLLPAVPTVSGCRNLGWSNTKGSSTAKYKAGATIRLNNNLLLYAVRQSLPYLVRFTNNQGTSVNEAFKKLYQKAGKNQVITMPAVPAVRGYVGLGWAENPRSTTVRYKQNDKVKVTKSVTYYAVYRRAKRFSVVFRCGDGSMPAEYAGLKKVVWEGSYLTLPSVPHRGGYKNIGWKLTIRGKTRYYKAGAKVKINGNFTFMANQRQILSVILHTNNGKVLATFEVTQGSSFTLPSVANPSGYTFMGWGTKANLICSPTNPIKPVYEAKEVISSVNSTVHLYEILFQRSREGSLTLSSLSSAVNKAMEKYSKVILAGDSRMAYLQRTLQNMTFFSVNKNSEKIAFVARPSIGLEWFKETGYPQLLEEIKKTEGRDKKPVAVILNFGINDLNNLEGYVSFYRSIENELKQQNCRLFIMSANPLNGAQRAAYAKSHGETKTRSEAPVREFNNGIRTALSGSYSYLDVYSWLMSTGYSTDASSLGKDISEDDGVHYAVNTYKRILNKGLALILS